MISDVENLFTQLLAIYVSSFVLCVYACVCLSFLRILLFIYLRERERSGVQGRGREVGEADALLSKESDARLYSKIQRL